MSNSFKRPMIKSRKSATNPNHLKNKLSTNITALEKAVKDLNEKHLTPNDNYIENSKLTGLKNKLTTNISGMKTKVNALKHEKSPNSPPLENSGQMNLKNHLKNNLSSMQRSTNKLRGTRRPVVKSRNGTKKSFVKADKKHVTSLQHNLSSLNKLLNLKGHYNPRSKPLSHRKHASWS